MVVGGAVVVEVVTETVVVGAVVVVDEVVVGAVVVVDAAVVVVTSVEDESPSEQPTITSATTTPTRSRDLRMRDTVPDRTASDPGVRCPSHVNGGAICRVRYGEW